MHALVADTPKIPASPYASIWRYGLFACIGWTVLVIASLFWNYEFLTDQAVFLATSDARSNWNKDQAFRRWAAGHGGVYVEIDENTPPNPYLAQLPERDVTTTSGKRLTLMNPAYIMRQVFDHFENLYGIKGKITSQILLNPNNKPDAWELNALKRFESGTQEIVEHTLIDGQPYVRMMRPMVMDQSCVKCHGHLGYKVGDIRGGVSVSVPLSPYLDATMKSRTALISTHGGVWFLGIGMIGFLVKRGCQRNAEQRAYQKNLQDREAKYRQLVENAPEIVYSFSNKKGNVYCSPRVTEVLGYTPEHIREHPMLWHDSIHPDDLPTVDAAIAKASHGQSFDIEYRIRDANGSWHWFQDRNIVLYGENGETVIDGLAADITAHKEAVMALIDSEKKFRSVYQSSSLTAIISVDEDGNVSMWNPGAQKAFGYTEQEIIGQPLTILMPKRYRVAHTSGLRQAREHKQNSFIGRTVELQGLHKDGHEFPLELSLGAWKSGDKTYFSGIINDITDRKAYEESLHKAKEDAEYANFAKTQFLANMSHELRTPLNGIIGFAEIMVAQMLGPLSETYQGYCRDIRNSGQHLLSLITEILDTSKLETGNVKLSESEINLRTLAEPCMRLIQQKADEAQVEVEVDFPNDLPMLYADETRIKQILLNLVSNAIKFNKPQGRVVLDAHVTDDKDFEITVKDTGRGIAQKDLSKVLEPFKQVEDIMTRSHEGSGLGLPLSKNLIELHGGTLKIDSELGVGTTVTVRFPAERIRDLTSVGA
ncbi:PAS domain S-box protein [Magnetovibrio sp.]|uniref:PAS domain S-box protein n=1 Tax=Magnetovibrio sp. TaxID=2024836 RepID=UPI002F93378A